MIKVGIFSQKGGQGKSTIVNLLATNIQIYFNPERNNNRVIVIDADYPQLSIKKIRDKEVKFLSNETSTNEYFLKKYSTVYRGNKNMKPFHIEAKDLLDVPEFLDAVENTFDIAIVDVVGSINTEGYNSRFLNKFDYIIIPSMVDVDDVQSNLDYINKVILPLKMGKFSEVYLKDKKEDPNKAFENYKKQQYKKHSNLKDFSVLFNRVENVAKGDLKAVSDWTNILRDNNINVFDKILFKRKKYSRYYIQDYRTGVKSTIFPVYETFTQAVVEEFINFIKI